MERVITYKVGGHFIRNIAGLIEEEYINKSKDISSLAFVFGGKRPGLFLKKELACRLKKSFFPPGFFSIDEFIEYCLFKREGFLRISELDACYIIYNLARDISKEIIKGRENFSQFLPWAKEIIYFIEQLDLEAVKFESLKGIQQKAGIGYDIPDNINCLLRDIILVRQAYHLQLKQRKAYSRGLMYLLAAEMEDIKLEGFERIFFCGFFYPHKTEKQIINNLCNSEKATLISQESTVGEPECKLSLQSAFDAHSQVCLVREIIKKVKNLDNTVIVLPQADNIIALFSEISSYVKDFNVSMGYPLKRSALYSLFECIFNAQASRKNNQYYAKDYLRVLSHPLVKNIKFLSQRSMTRVIVHKIEEVLLGIEDTSLGGSLFFELSEAENLNSLFDLAQMTLKRMDITAGRDELRLAVKELHKSLFLNWENLSNFDSFALSLEQFLGILLSKGNLGGYPLNLKMAEKVFSIKDELKSASFNKEHFAKEEIFKIFKDRLSCEIISFSGSPLKGLQILGLLETRCLNFENVIVMDVNEAVLPNLKIYEPLIPREIMISLGINRLEKEDQIQRYHFRSLIANAKNVYLIYRQSDEKEKSRFIEELIWERQKKLNNLDVFPQTSASFKVKVLPKRLEIKKDSKTIAFLKELEYSASSVNMYLHCPLRFYYQYVLGLREKDDLSQEPESRFIGTFIHEFLEGAFRNFIGRRAVIDNDFRREFMKNLDDKFSNEFSRRMKSGSFLVKKIIDFRMQLFLDNEREREVRQVLCLEEPFKAKIKLGGAEFNFCAIIDRIDRLSDGSILIIDYKTGSSDILPEDNPEKIQSFGFQRPSLKRTIKSFQLPLYLYLVEKSRRYYSQHINAALYSIKDLKVGRLFRQDVQSADDKEKIMSCYIKALSFILSEILSPEAAFKADDEDKWFCSSCPFFYLCR